ncbi:MAG: hypothetical protein ACFNME_02320 [Actinomyces dentalis]|jgi:hypothetical protein
MTTASTIHPKERGSVRANDPVTSQWAADSITDATTSQAVVLNRVRNSNAPGAFTLADVERFTSGVLSPSRARTAVRELQNKGLIEETGRFEVTVSGRKARLLALTDTGRAAA